MERALSRQQSLERITLRLLREAPFLKAMEQAGSQVRFLERTSLQCQVERLTASLPCGMDLRSLWMALQFQARIRQAHLCSGMQAGILVRERSRVQAW